MNLADKVWVEIVGKIIIARIRGVPTEQLVTECQRRVVALQADTGCNLVMYDALELERPPIKIVVTQQAFSAVLNRSSLKVAIVVPNTAF